MKLLDWFRRPEQKKIVVRQFSAGQVDRLVNSWKTDALSLDEDLKLHLDAMRARSREMWANNPYAKKFIEQVKKNVVGPRGIAFQSKVTNARGKLDSTANRRIEQAWKKQAKRANFTVTGKLSYKQALDLYVESLARDGEVLLLRHRSRGETGYQIQFLDPARLDTRKNREPGGGLARIEMGVEKDSYGKPIAYWLIDGRHPDDHRGQTYNHKRYPASEVFHDFLQIQPEQTRGIPWMHAALRELHHLGAYKEAAIVAARVGANKVGWITSPDGMGFSGDDTDEDGAIIMDAEAGQFGQLAPGYSVQSWDPDYPHQQYADFNKAVLRGIASGFGTAYNTFANDLEGVNFSSMRGGVQDERDTWMSIQDFVISAFCEPLYEDWIAIQRINPASDLGSLNGPNEKFMHPTFIPRRWQWVDPLKDVQANTQLNEANAMSVSEIIRERGRDPEEVFREIAEEKAKMEELGITKQEAMSKAPEEEDDSGDDPEE